MKLGFENRRNLILAGVLGVVAILVIGHEFMPSSSTNASTATATNSPVSLASTTSSKHHGLGTDKKEHVPQSLDPTLHLQELAASEQIEYEGSGRNIFVSQAEVVIPKPLAPGVVGPNDPKPYQPPPVATAPPIPLKYFGFSNQPGEPKKVFLSKGEDVFIAVEGEIVDRRYKVVRISPTAVEIQDVVGSGPPQSIPLTQG
ncbi:MAG: hypothetical protein WAM78_06455 [Candidatus Sulfotelmatobacter sp.]